MLVSFISILFYGVLSFCATGNINSFVGDADAALGSGDVFHAYRSYVYVEEYKPVQFAKLALEGYLQSTFLLAPPSRARQECDRLTSGKDKASISKAAYVCGLEYTESKKPEMAEIYLTKIERTSHFFWPAQILLATDDLLEDSPAKVLDRLHVQELNQYKKYDLENDFQLALARATVSLNRFEEALIHYQTVASNSPSYVIAVEETAWLFYKLQKYESAQVLIDVLKTNYEAAFRGAQKIRVPAISYFSARYLEAYIELAQQRTDSALTAFSQLQTDFESFTATLKTDMDPIASVQAVKEHSEKWTDSRNFPDFLQHQLLLIGIWVAPETKIKIERDITLYTAYVHEVTRTTSYSTEFKTELANYADDIKGLRDRIIDVLKLDLADSLKKTNQGLNAFVLKTHLGRLEVASIVRAQGARSLDDVIDEYLAKVHQMNELAPP